MFKFTKKDILYLLGVIFIASVLRFFWLEKIPGGFFRDEAAIGYNAYSIGGTLKDEYGMRLPLVFRSFEVFFLPFYIYLTAIVTGIFGLSVFSTRFISAFYGVSEVFIIYLLIKDIWNSKAALVCSFIMAITPWHIFYSRGAFEGNLALTLFSAGFFFWIKFIKNKKLGWFFLSGLSFLLSMYSYQSERLVVPLFILFAAFQFRKNIWNSRKNLILPVVFLLIMFVPLFSITLSPAGYHRSLGVSFFTEKGNINSTQKINNKNLTKILPLYISYFSPRNLFSDEDYNRQRTVENSSVFYVWTFPFLIYGIYKVLKIIRKDEIKLLLVWMLLGPLPAAFTPDPFHTYRALLVFIPLTIFIGLGIYYFIVLFRRNYQIIAYLAIFTLSFVALIKFIFNYAIITQVTRARDWDYGYKQIVDFILPLSNKSKVVVDDIWTESYIQFLYFSNTDPKIYQSEVAKLGDVHDYYYKNASRIRPNKYANFEFRKVDWPKERGNAGVIFVISSDRLPKSEYINDPKVQLLKEILYPDGKSAYRIVKIHN